MAPRHDVFPAFNSNEVIMLRPTTQLQPSREDFLEEGMSQNPFQLLSEEVCQYLLKFSSVKALASLDVKDINSLSAEDVAQVSRDMTRISCIDRQFYASACLFISRRPPIKEYIHQQKMLLKKSKEIITLNDIIDEEQAKKQQCGIGTFCIALGLTIALTTAAIHNRDNIKKSLAFTALAIFMFVTLVTNTVLAYKSKTRRDDAYRRLFQLTDVEAARPAPTERPTFVL